VRGGEGGLQQSIYSREMKNLLVFAILCVRQNFAATRSKRHHLVELMRQQQAARGITCLR
jgi:hypothetical protein